MRLVCLCLASVLLGSSAHSQQKSPESSKPVQERKSDAPPAKCGDLGFWAKMLDAAFDGDENQLRKLAPFIADSDDTIWDTLIDCSKATKMSPERTEAFRLAAIWEALRADSYREIYKASLVLVKSPQCRDLDQLKGKVDAADKENGKFTQGDFDSVFLALRTCAQDSVRLNSNSEHLRL